MTALSRALDGLEFVLRQVILVVYAVIVVIVTFQVVNRFWLHWPIVWLSDLAIICFIWLGFLTGGLAVRDNGHFRLSLALDLLGESRARRFLELLSVAIMLAVFGLLLVTGYEMAQRGLREISPGLQVPMTWAYASLPVAAIPALLFALELGLKELTGVAAHEREFTTELDDATEEQG